MAALVKAVDGAAALAKAVEGASVETTLVDEGEHGSDSDGDNSRYDKQHYWDRRFETEEGYEWLCGFEHVKVLLEEEFPIGETRWRDARILVLGCGNSPFSRELHDIAGYQNVTSCDFSAVVIEKMRVKHASSHPALHWEVADVRALGEKFSDNAFDIVIDKACLDALVCNEGDPWDPNVDTINNMTAALQSVVHVLCPGGVFVSIGFQQPHFRKRYLQLQGQKFGWEENIVVKKIDAGLGYFWFSCPLSQDTSEHCDDRSCMSRSEGTNNMEKGGRDEGEDSSSEEDDSEVDGPSPELSAETLAVLTSMGLAPKKEE